VRSICVFCGSSVGGDSRYAGAARALGSAIAASDRRLVFGGGRVGLMGVLADAALEAGGSVVGVIPQALVDREIAHTELTELRVVGSMHERKALMAELSDGFIALPGGVGTLEEFFETWTWGQLGLHVKPYGLLDVAGFYEPLLIFLRRLVQEGFVRADHHDMLLVDTVPQYLLERMATHRTPAMPKWVDRAST
jgi:uncharacterized protein (TIGR00730 family)